jgi:hypothetical protein
MSHASRPCSSTDECLTQERDNYCSDTYEDRVQGWDEVESTGLTWNIPCDYFMPTRLSLPWISIYRRLIRLPPWHMKSAYRWSYNNRMHPSTPCLKCSLDDTRCLLRGYWGVKTLTSSVLMQETRGLLYGTGTHKLGCRSRRLLRCW